jgi:hypothetical protein
MEPRKSFTCEWPKNLPVHLEKHFIRGYYDGDGGISFNSNSKNYCVGIISSISFITTMRKKIFDLTELNLSLCIKSKRYSQPMATLVIHSNLKAAKFLRWLYADCHIKLNRKYNKYQELLARIEQIKQNKLTRHNKYLEYLERKQDEQDQRFANKMKNKSSKYYGVSFSRKTDKWTVRTKHTNNKAICFTTELEAATFSYSLVEDKSSLEKYQKLPTA